MGIIYKYSIPYGAKMISIPLSEVRHMSMEAGDSQALEWINTCIQREGFVITDTFYGPMYTEDTMIFFVTKASNITKVWRTFKFAFQIWWSKVNG